MKRVEGAPLVEVVEGAARLLVPEGNRERGPGTRGEGVFYNPAMALGRDLTVLLLDAAAGEGWRMLDGLSASGARAVRAAVAVPRVAAHANDWNPVACDLIRKNAERNGVNVEVTRANLGALLWESSWHVVDIDPFGSPAPFVDAACRATRDRGLLAITATDAPALAGVYPDVAERRYLARTLRANEGHEIALRVLAGFAARQGAKWECAFTPVAAYASDHYFRVVLRARRGAARADDALASVGLYIRCRACGDRRFERAAPAACPACGGKVAVAGPLWTGLLGERALLEAMRKAADGHALARGADAAKLLDRLAGEADVAGHVFDIPEETSRAGLEAVPRTVDVIAALARAGRVATRTHILPTALRTDATAAEFAAALKAAGP
ncbi:MAG TPA: tRNA (guanine(10)-N(2))-dimethyltransferase [Candidatus Thermoplasmatota archaeon]|nr:tRNA (guanine(10)-N(2))-dimethyltransferase [Candidatus Thermoplasmatota archaeon]